MKLLALTCLVLLAVPATLALSEAELLEEFQSLGASFGADYVSALEVATTVGEGEATDATASATGNTVAQAGTPSMIHPDAGALSTYLPESGPYDNPATDTTPTPTIPSTPSCTIRGQTIFEIRKMRADAKQIGLSIMYEIQTMEKRKAYIEQMTSYLNDRIRELNKVKRDLAAEQRWIQVSNQRISELAQKEKLIKLQDVMSCIKSEKDRLEGERGTKTSALASMMQQAAQLESNIKSIRNNMNTVTGQFNSMPGMNPATGSHTLGLNMATGVNGAVAPNAQVNANANG